MNDGEQKLFEFDNTYVRDLPELGVAWKASDVPSPELVAFNHELAAEISVDPELLESQEGVAVLAGNVVPLGATPVAMVYAGHQFGGYSPRLGDGRALLLGEVVDGSGRRVDLHLKGSGRTPFARGGDGKATIGPMLREFLMAEAIHALGIPTGRALAVVTTGEQVMREGPEPGAVLTRVAASHLRVGTFEYAARLEDGSVLKRLADYAIARHYPALAETEQPYLGLFDAVVEAQASLIARWMLIGFIHGVMNTDNTTISGQTIDYGPCAFMDRYDQSTVYSSIDHQGRYAYGNQPTIAQWNLARLAETLIPLIATDADNSAANIAANDNAAGNSAANNSATNNNAADDDAAVALLSEHLSRFPELFRRYWADGMRGKLGLTDAADDDPALFGQLLESLQSQRIDYTSLFRALADLLRGKPMALAKLSGDRSTIEAWADTWLERVASEGRAAAEVADEMDQINPLYIPRNHLVDEALDAANGGDLSPFDQLLDVVTEPYVEREGLERYAEPAPDSFDQTFRTYCGT